jgi:hypothetical protein
MAVKLPKPPPDDGTRAEFEAFLTGFALAVFGIKRAFPNFDATEIWNSANDAATELYPPFDPLPPPVKRSDDGNRKDGIEMSED